MESKEFRKGIIQLEWEHKKNLMKIEDLKNKMRTINMMKVTREIQSYLNQEDHDAKVAQEVSILEQTILMQKRVKSCLVRLMIVQLYWYLLGYQDDSVYQIKSLLVNKQNSSDENCTERCKTSQHITEKEHELSKPNHDCTTVPYFNFI